jgi:hypothetical protein
LGLTPKVLELRNERLEGFEDLGCEEEMIGEGKIGLVEAEDAIDGSSKCLVSLCFCSVFFALFFDD